MAEISQVTGAVGFSEPVRRNPESPFVSVYNQAVVIQLLRWLHKNVVEHTRTS